MLHTSSVWYTRQIIFHATIGHLAGGLHGSLLSTTLSWHQMHYSNTSFHLSSTETYELIYLPYLEHMSWHICTHYPKHSLNARYTHYPKHSLNARVCRCDHDESLLSIILYNVLNQCLKMIPGVMYLASTTPDITGVFVKMKNLCSINATNQATWENFYPRFGVQASAW